MGFDNKESRINGKAQNKIKKGMPICPFCGRNPDWVMRVDDDSEGGVICRCKSCASELCLEKDGFSYGDSVRVVGIGNSNVHNLRLGGVYSISTLNNLVSVETNDEAGGDVFDEHVSVPNGFLGATDAPNTVQSQSVYQSVSSTQRVNKKKQIIVGTVTCIVLFLTILFVVLFTLDLAEKPNANDLAVVEKSSMQVEKVFDYYTVTITGEMKNTSSEDIDYVSVTFTLFDSEGNVIGSAYDNLNNLKSGQVWKYSATGMTDVGKPVSWECSDLTIRCY